MEEFIFHIFNNNNLSEEKYAIAAHHMCNVHGLRTMNGKIQRWWYRLWVERCILLASMNIRLRGTVAFHVHHSGKAIRDKESEPHEMNVTACNMYDARCNLPTFFFSLFSSIEIVPWRSCIGGAQHIAQVHRSMCGKNGIKERTEWNMNVTKKNTSQ